MTATTDRTQPTGVHELPACGDVPMLIGGEFVGAAGGEWTDVVSPGSLTVIGRVPTGGAAVDEVSFTGSTEVGRGVGAEAGERIVPVSLELGGKSPTIVWPDSARQGQSCTAGPRLHLHEDVHDEVLDRLVAELQTFVVGDPLDERTDMGTLIDQTQFDTVRDHIEDGGSRSGVTTALDGAGQVPDGLDGWYLGPTVCFRATNDWLLIREEIFGPVMAVISAANRIESGWVQVDQGGGQLVGQSYGGLEASGIGRESSPEGMLESFTSTEQVNVELTPGL
jgi:aldehyde dehydrogenase (NAD+)